MRKLAFTFTEEIDEAVSAAAAESYTTREGEMITAEVVAVGPGGEVLLKMRDGSFACLPAEEAIPDKRYVQGDSVSALVVGVELRTWAADKRAPVIVSQAIAGLLAEVFKAEVPEVLRGTALRVSQIRHTHVCRLPARNHVVTTYTTNALFRPITAHPIPHTWHLHTRD